MHEKILNFSASTKHTYSDSCFVVIMTHGFRNHYEGTDGEFLKIDDICKLFTKKKSPSLYNKPKIFIMIACNKDDYQYQHSNEEKTEKYLNKKFKNMFVLFSSGQGNNLRHKKWGSVFVKMLEQVINDCKSTESFLDICKKIKSMMLEMKICKTGDVPQVCNYIYAKNCKPLYLRREDKVIADSNTEPNEEIEASTKSSEMDLSEFSFDWPRLTCAEQPKNRRQRGFHGAPKKVDRKGNCAMRHR